MVVAILNPQDCLKKSSSSSSSSSPPKMKVVKYPPPNANSKVNRSNRNLPCRPKHSTPTLKPQPNKIVMGQVKLLKRGELNDTPTKPAPVDGGKPDLGSTDPLGPNPKLIPVDRVSGLYAGSSMFVASPPPSSVPFPAFFTKNIISDATSDLRRILRLDLH